MMRDTIFVKRTCFFFS